MPNAQRAVIEVNLRNDGETVEFRVTEAHSAPTRRAASPLECRPDEAVFALPRSGPTRADVEAAGRRLYDSLVRNPDAQAMFTVSSQLGPQAFPLLVQIEAPDAERLPWEVLWSAPPGGFRALHPSRQWPIARMVAGRSRPESLTRTAGPALRLAVVVAAAEQNGVAEWQALRAALDPAVLPMPVELLAIASEDATRAAIQTDLDAWSAAVAGPPRTGMVTVAPDALALVNTLQGFAPNVVHLFCHGIADPRPHLLIETPADRTRGDGLSSIRLDAQALSQLARATSIWLCVLNCCQGATSTPNLHSLAKEIVAAGAPAVVAMRESVDVVDANAFAGAFYRALLPALACELTSPALPASGAYGHPLPDMLWASALFDARQLLSMTNRRDPSSSPEWTYPVLYVNRDDLRLVYAAPPPVPLQPPAPGASPASSGPEYAERELRATLAALLDFRAPMLASAAAPPAALAVLTDEIARLRTRLGLPPEPAR